MNKLFKKGLVSLAAASVLTTGAMASSVIADLDSKDKSYHFKDVNNSIDVNTTTIQELGESGFNSAGYFTIKIPKGLRLAASTNNSLIIPTSALGTKDNPSPIVINEDVVDDGASDKNESALIWINTSATGDENTTYSVLNVAVDINTSDYIKHVYLASAIETSANTDNSNSNKDKVELAKYSNLDVASAGDDKNVTVGQVYYDSTAEETYITLAVKNPTDSISTAVIRGLNLVVLDANKTATLTYEILDGDANGANGIGVTSQTIQIAKTQETPFTVVMTDTSAKNVKVGTNQKMTNFGIHFADNAKVESDENITIAFDKGVLFDVNASEKIANDKNITSTVTNYQTGWQTIGSDSNADTFLSSDRTTLKLDMNTSKDVDNQDINITGNPKIIDASSASVGDVVKLTVSGEGTKLGGYSVTLENFLKVVQDGMSFQVKDGIDVAKTQVVAGRQFQKVADINVTEKLDDSFSDGKTLVFTLEDGVTWAAKPGSVTANGGTEATEITPDGASYTVTFADSNTSTINVKSDDGTQQSLLLTGLKVNVPDTLTAGSKIRLTISGTNTENMAIDPKTIDIATVATTIANVSSTHEISESAGTLISTKGTLSADKANFVVSEPAKELLEVGKTITATLENGKFTGTVSNPDRTTGAFQVGTGTISTDKKTVTWTITSASTFTEGEGNVTFKLPSVDFSSVTTEGEQSITIGGTAGVSGSVVIAKLVNGNVVTDGQLSGAVEPGSVDVDGNTFTIIEQIKQGLNNTSNNGQQFKLVSNDPKVTFAGGYTLTYKKEGVKKKKK